MSEAPDKPQLMNLKQLCDRAEHLFLVLTSQEEIDNDELDFSDDELMRKWLDEYSDWKRQGELDRQKYGDDH